MWEKMTRIEQISGLLLHFCLSDRIFYRLQYKATAAEKDQFLRSAIESSFSKNFRCFSRCIAGWPCNARHPHFFATERRKMIWMDNKNAFLSLPRYQNGRDQKKVPALAAAFQAQLPVGRCMLRRKEIFFIPPEAPMTNTECAGGGDNFVAKRITPCLILKLTIYTQTQRIHVNFFLRNPRKPTVLRASLPPAENRIWSS